MTRELDYTYEKRYANIYLYRSCFVVYPTQKHKKDLIPKRIPRALFFFVLRNADTLATTENTFILNHLQSDLAVGAKKG